MNYSLIKGIQKGKEEFMFKHWQVGNDGHYYVYSESIEEIREKFDIKDPNSNL